MEWNEVIDISKEYDFHVSFELPREELPYPSKKLGFRKETGEPEGQEADFRLAISTGEALHVKVFSDVYRIHRDRFDPRFHPLLHLVYDAPEIILTIALLSIFIVYAAWDISKTDKKHQRLKAVLHFVLTIIIAVSGYTLIKAIREFLETKNSNFST